MHIFKRFKYEPKCFVDNDSNIYAEKKSLSKTNKNYEAFAKAIASIN